MKKDKIKELHSEVCPDCDETNQFPQSCGVWQTIQRAYTLGERAGLMRAAEYVDLYEPAIATSLRIMADAEPSEPKEKP